MKVTLVPGRELGSDLAAAWTRLQAANPDLVSPYFHPEFTKSIAAVRSDVEVAVVEADGSTVALFPFQREQISHALPVGGIISDYQGSSFHPPSSSKGADLTPGISIICSHHNRP
jgi:CelD/BcsL family acetyltransferase involved in cellulose biosynthesis